MDPQNVNQQVELNAIPHSAPLRKPPAIQRNDSCSDASEAGCLTLPSPLVNDLKLMSRSAQVAAQGVAIRQGETT
jgi:hypothetical protein